jgi:hypothetical protein
MASLLIPGLVAREQQIEDLGDDLAVVDRTFSSVRNVADQPARLRHIAVDDAEEQQLDSPPRPDSRPATINLTTPVLSVGAPPRWGTFKRT